MTPRNARILQATAAFAVAAAIASAAWYAYRTLASHPMKFVRYEGDLARVPREELEALSQTIRSYDSLALARVREAALRLSGVREASVRRRFPDTVEIRLEAHEPLARWDERRLVSRRGELFVAQPQEALPLFGGPDAMAATMAREYPAIAAGLAPLGDLSELRLSARGAWHAVLDSGLSLELGRGDVQPRIARFAAAAPRLAAAGVTPRHADLRYANGFALRNPFALSAAAAKPAAARAKGAR